MSDRSEAPQFSPIQPESPGVPVLTGSHPATLVSAAFTARPIYPQRTNYATFDPAFQRPSLSVPRHALSLSATPFTLTPRRINNAWLNNALTTSSIEQRAGSEPTTGWCRQNADVNTWHTSLPPALEGTPWSLRDRLPSPERSPTPEEKVLESTEAEGDPVVALNRANRESQTIIRRELDAHIELEDENRRLRDRNGLLETLYATYTVADGRLQRERDDAVRGRHLAEQRVYRLQSDLAASQRERLQPDGNSLQQPGGLEYERDGLELERNHYLELAHQRLTENHTLQDQVTRLSLQLQATHGLAVSPPVDPSPVASPSFAAPSFSPFSVVSPPVVPPPVNTPPTISPHYSPPPAAQPQPSIENDAAPIMNSVRGSRSGRGRGGARGRAGRRGRGSGAATREKRERACKVKKSYKV